MRKQRQSTYLVEPIMVMHQCPWVALIDRSFFYATGILRAAMAIDRGLVVFWQEAGPGTAGTSRRRRHSR
jgi:hypothetical protein